MSDSQEIENLKPFLKWAGGKRWFVTNYKNLVPQNYNRYIEPFLGSGALYFHLKPTTAILGDINKELIETYEAIRDDWKRVYKHLKKSHRKHSEAYYYSVRKSKPRLLATKAAKFIYLNRTCWNGLYRVNTQGKFNVPIGTKETVIYEDDNFHIISELLKRTKLLAVDFEILVNMACHNDLLFVDPPYTVRHNNNSFIKYNEKLFSWADQERLCEALKRAKKRGAIILATNAYHESVKQLYKDEFYISKITRTSTISSNKNSRKKYDELLISSEEINAQHS